MNYALVFKTIGNMLGIEAGLLLVPVVVSFVHSSEDTMAFLWTILILAVLGGSLSLLRPKNVRFATGEAFAVVAISWIVSSLLGVLPFYFSGHLSFVDSIFESVSGFTTSGATILTDVESLPEGLLFWRSFLHWIGGMGVLVFMLAVMPGVNASSVNILRAESTGPSPDRIVPKLKESARLLYLIYTVMTVLLVILLYIFGLPLYDALTHAFSTAGTGGFSSRNASVGAYGNIAVEVIITIFMFLFGVSFSLYFYLFNKKFKQAFLDEELRVYFGVVVAAILIITLDISGIYNSVQEALRYSSFQVLSIISTAGFSTANYELWPTLSRSVLFILMITGCCAGSTGGGIKLIRFLILFKAVRIEINKIIYPKSVKVIMVNDKKVDDRIVSNASMFLFVYLLFFLVALLIVSLENKDMVSTTTAVISTLNNIGPGFGIAGPVGSYAEFSNLSKIVFSVCMLAGRLEIFPLLILLRPSIWKNKG